MACSKPVLSEADVLAQWAIAREYEKAGRGTEFYLGTEFLFTDRSSGCDIRFPTTAISRYARRHHSIVLGLEDETSSVDSGVGIDVASEDDEVFVAPTLDLLTERRVLEIFDEKERTWLTEMRAMERRLSTRISNARASMEENMAEVETSLTAEMRQGRGAAAVYQIPVDSGAPVTVVGAATLDREVALYREVDEQIKKGLKDIKETLERALAACPAGPAGPTGLTGGVKSSRAKLVKKNN